MIAPTPSPFEVLAKSKGYDLAPAISPIPTRTYADRATQDAFDMWNAGAGYVERMVTESTIETEALREKIQALACNK